MFYVLFLRVAGMMGVSIVWRINLSLSVSNLFWKDNVHVKSNHCTLIYQSLSCSVFQYVSFKCFIEA